MTQTRMPWSEEALHTWFVSKLAAELELDASEIDPLQPFAQYGVDSVLAVGLIADLEDETGRTLAPTLLWEYPSIAAITQYLADQLP